ncbi:terminase small subunit [Tepidibacillus marianensis]|uniref:terminase small subunit n=1 Tax=Tepidibacillus marianensis TaxID=3131995 RepID=UPI0030CF1626
MAKLTTKQIAFCDYYIETGNATEAAIKAGYSKKSAKEVGYENLTKPHLKSYIDERMKQLESERIASQEEILQFLTSVIRGEVTEEVPLLIGDGMQTLKDKNVNIKDRVKAAELLGKRYAMWTEKVNFDADIGVQIVDDIGSEGNDED